MRWLGRIDPGSGVGGAGHFAIMRRPKATVEAYAMESCFDRPALKCGADVSAASLGAGRAVSPRDGADVAVGTRPPALSTGTVPSDPAPRTASRGVQALEITRPSASVESLDGMFGVYTCAPHEGPAEPYSRCGFGPR